MKICMKRFIINLMTLIFLFELIPFGEMGIKFGFFKKAEAYYTQLETVAPGYVISADEGGIVFDLSQRLSDTMSVESFSVKNTNPEQQKKDLKEESIDGVRWLSKDQMINGHIYEIESKIYDSDTENTLTYINSFKFTDKNVAYNPRVSMSKFDPNRMVTQDVIFDFSECKELIDSSNNLKFEILNSDLTNVDILDPISLNKNDLVKNKYQYTIYRASSIFKGNRDYIVRLNADGVVWDKMISCVVKSNPSIVENFKAPNVNIAYSTKQKIFSVYLTTLGIFKKKDDLQHVDMKVVLSNKKGFNPLEKNVSPIMGAANFSVPEEYVKSKTPTDIRIYFTDKYTKLVLAEYLFQITFNGFSGNGNEPPLIWRGMEYTAKLDSSGYKVTRINPFHDGNKNEGNKRTVPHAWDGMPRSHYITFYDNKLENQIGGEFRCDVLRKREEFLWINHNVEGANFTVPFKDIKQGFNSYNVKFESSSQYEEWAYAYIPIGFYADIIDIKDLDVNVKDVKANSSGDKYSFTLEIKNQNVITGDKMSIIDDNGKEYIATTNSSKSFNFKDVPLIFGGKYVVTYKKISGLVHFSSTDLSVLFNPVIVGISSNGQDAIEINVDKKYEKIVNSNSGQNKLKILHMNGNSTGNEFSNFGIGKTNFVLNSSLVDGNFYIAELSNSKGEVFKTTFEYTPMRISLSDVTGTTAKLDWKYPNNYLITDGDVMNIYFKKEGSNYPAVADAKIMHGFQGIDFNDVTTYTLKNMSPNVNYTAKLELVTNEGMIYMDEVEFVTSTFKILNEEIEGISEDGIVNSKSVNFKWDVNLGDIEFYPSDKIELFVKLRSHSAFPKTPNEVIRDDINRIRRFKFDVENYYESYSAKVVYTIGGVRHTSKILDFKVEPSGIELSMGDITDSSAIINWEYPKDIEILNNHEVRVYLKKETDIDFKHMKTYKQSENPIKDIKSHKFEKLQVDTIYKAKIVYKIGEKVVAGVTEDITQEKEIEFKTDKFIINNLSIDRRNEKGTEVTLKWNVENKNYLYQPTDKVNVYVKERDDSSSKYVSVAGGYANLENFRSFNLDIPKYNVNYDIKLTYELSGKEVSAYTNYKVEMGDIKFNIDSIEDTKVKVSWEYPEKCQIIYDDKIEVSLKNLDDANEAIKSESKIHDLGSNINEFKTQEFSLTQNKMYEVKVKFSSYRAEPIETSYRFKAVSGFQILSLDGEAVDSKSFKLNWNFYNNNQEFNQDSKVEILYKEESQLDSQNSVQRENEDELFKNINPVLTKTGSDLGRFKSHIVEGLDINKEYLFRIRYTIVGENSNTGENPKVVYKDIKGKPELGNISASAIDVQPTGVKIAIEYPEGYEIVEGDILDIFIKDDGNKNYEVKPNFTGKHGSGEEDVDLNEVTMLDILGLSPNTDYNAKVVFWPEGGLDKKQEVELSFKTDVIKGISELVIGDILDYVVKVGVKMDPEGLILSDKDSCKIFIKKKDQSYYPDVANGEMRGDLFNEEKFVSAYFDELNAEYTVKAVVNIGGNEFEYETDFVSKVDDFNIDVREINPMTTQVEWRYPNNYTLVDGESIQIFIKYKDEDDFLTEPDLELIQSEELNLYDMNLVELYALIPDTDYEVKVKLNLLEVDIQPIIKEFTTTTFEIENLEIVDVSSDGMSLAWDLSTEELDFIDDYDNLAIFIKNRNEDDYDFSNPVAEFTEDLNNIRSVSFHTGEILADVDVYVSYLIEDYEAAMEISYTAIELNVEVQDDGVLVEWSYPPGTEFEPEDRLDIYLKHANKSGYKTEPNFRYTHDEDGDLTELNQIFFKKLEKGNYTMKFSLITADMRYNPIEIEFSTEGSQEVIDGIELKFNGKSSGRKIELDIVGDEEFDYEQGFYIDPEGLDLEIDEDRNKFIVLNLVPNKEYKNIIITFFTVDDEEVNFVVKNVKIEPETLLEEFITNIYKFAFERYPDEEGYSYWLGKLLEKGEVTGKFVLYNLMFAEREFSDRNLSDDDLIKVLYQIVVNREYDEGGLNYWIGEYRNTYLPQANNDSYEAQKAIVERMLHEQEFKDLCNKMGILW